MPLSRLSSVLSSVTMLDIELDDVTLPLRQSLIALVGDLQFVKIYRNIFVDIIATTDAYSKFARLFNVKNM